MIMTGRPYKALLAAIAALCFLGAGLVQRELVSERDALGLTRYPELKGAPPVLSLTTVALGGFRGLISNLLWIRANDLQDQDKYFEMVQLADWITKLEPHIPQVWVHLAWNMAYNISVKFREPTDRWRWLERGIELLRDDGLRYNPDDVLIHRELAWFYQHKMGANLDDAQWYYKQMWASEMSKIIKTNHPNWDELINPKTDDAKQRVELLTNKYKLDPAFMKDLDEKYGPLEWRLPEAHAIYWAAQGLEAAKRNPRRIETNDLIMLRRVIYQSMQLSFQRGRLVLDDPKRPFEYGPNMDIIPKVSAAYEQEMQEDPKNRDHIETAHRNFLRDAVFLLFTYDRQKEAIKWFKYIGEKYPDKPLLLAQPNSLPRNISLEDYSMGRIEEEVGSLGQDKAEAIIEALETTAFRDLVIGEDAHYVGMDHLAEIIWKKYDVKVSFNEKTQMRVGLRPFKEIKMSVLKRLLNGGLPPEYAAVLATKTGQKWPPDKTPEPTVIVAPPTAGPTNNVAPTNAPPAGTLF
jgi:hypothetical protein